ncbi:hypothetical protein [Brevundimonas subvibrioides]|uniref:hypothetical protein n=1 Tax=Brevundimonas subvibrioides TaxID=74313 RepID=UPI0032D58004
MLHILAAVALIVQQTAPAAGGTDLTRMLNGAPPVTTSAPRPTAPATQPAPRPANAPATSASATPTTRPATAPVVSSGTTPVAPATSSAPVRAPAPSGTTATPRPVPTPGPANTTTTPAPAGEAVVAPVEPPPPAPVALDARAVAALPFTVSLPTGFTITTGRPGPDFNIYTIRRGGQPFVMVYTGSASQFPIYSGEMVEAGGRASVVANEEGRRVALEHLFTRAAAPTEIHVWITSLDGADRLLAEQIGQSVDAR